MGILLKKFDGGECPGEAQGCRMMGKNEVSHNCNTPDTA